MRRLCLFERHAWRPPTRRAEHQRPVRSVRCVARPRPVGRGPAVVALGAEVVLHIARVNGKAKLLGIGGTMRIVTDDACNPFPSRDGLARALFLVVRVHTPAGENCLSDVAPLAGSAWTKRN